MATSLPLAFDPLFVLPGQMPPGYRYKLQGIFRDGQRANAAGHIKQSNPHPAGSEAHARWKDGWETAECYGGDIGPEFFEVEPLHGEPCIGHAQATSESAVALAS